MGEYLATLMSTRCEASHITKYNNFFPQKYKIKLHIDLIFGKEIAKLVKFKLDFFFFFQKSRNFFGQKTKTIVQTNITC